MELSIANFRLPIEHFSTGLENRQLAIDNRK